MVLAHEDEDEPDKHPYCFVDRDMLIRYLRGGIGHKVLQGIVKIIDALIALRGTISREAEQETDGVMGNCLNDDESPDEHECKDDEHECKDDEHEHKDDEHEQEDDDEGKQGDDGDKHEHEDDGDESDNNEAGKSKDETNDDPEDEYREFGFTCL
ncbi:hypothetical protein BDY19DRAFT_995883 [Irpex rosettiformis]|uniref:Uncharacterized protein n=1 Tax=Irpex rosettiformis TaxID=378272 RepID=A0ACB8TX23_9APHY|nr:hypothetical protein BDY19DRAFT_995883 [Irpex rosettiformis]